ncbi:hypothetical protein NL676_018801 [Syzygium grande]|nr:hypothetical protein NL676_018801 [Syzygium grande]
MCWITCETYWRALGHICCFVWYKTSSTKRVYRGRRRFRDFEAGHSLGDISYDYSSRHLSASRKRKLLRERTEGPLASYSNHSHRHHRHHRHRHVKLKSRCVSFASRRGSRRSRISRHHQISTRRTKLQSRSKSERRWGSRRRQVGTGVVAVSSTVKFGDLAWRLTLHCCGGGGWGCLCSGRMARPSGYSELNDGACFVVETLGSKGKGVGDKVVRGEARMAVVDDLGPRS